VAEDLQTPSVHNCLYILPSENLANYLVSPLLDGNDYHSWSRSMKITLSVKNKLEFVDGTMPELRRMIKSIQLGEDAIKW